MGKLLLAFLIVPIVELAIIIRVGGMLGFWPTLGLLIVVSVVGAWLVKWQGIFTLRRMQQSIAQGQVPTKQLIDGALILVAGALMLTPGFLTDALGLALLIPPSRAAIRAYLTRRYQGRIETYTAPGPRPDDGRSPGPGDVIDV